MPIVAVTALEWILISSLAAIYRTLVFTVAIISYRKGHVVWFIVGFFFPIAWLIAAMLPAKPGSGYDGPLR